MFYFRPHQKWYLIYQAGMPNSEKMWVAYSTTADLADPASWTTARPMLDGGPTDTRTVGGLDYWIICDDANAWLFFTSLDGRLWRMQTTLQQFPDGLTDCQLALRGSFFEASHVYRIADRNQYLLLIEQKGQRHFKSWTAERLDGPWVPLQTTQNAPFAGSANIRPAGGVQPWTDNISHGELVRKSSDERLLVDLKNPKFVFQGMLQKHKQATSYGAFLWRIGMLTPVPSTPTAQPKSNR